MIKYVIEIFALYCVLAVIVFSVGLLFEDWIGLVLMGFAIVWRMIIALDRRIVSKGKEK